MPTRPRPPSASFRLRLEWCLAAALPIGLTLCPASLAGGPLPSCGNGAIEIGEDCDDGNGFDLDGCTRSCRYEAIHRVIALEMASGPAPMRCMTTTNALGSAFSAAGLAAVNDTIAAGLLGESALLLDLLDLDDATGMNDPALDLGVLAARPDPRSPRVGLDAWFIATPDALDGDDRPVEILTGGSATAGEIAAGPADLELPFLGGELRLLDAIGAALASDMTSEPAPPPDAFAAGLVAFETLDGAGATHGLCGNVTVGSLAQIPVPDELATGVTACQTCSGSRTYVACSAGQPVDATCHSLLDVVVGGCRNVGCLVTVLTPTQPDVGTGGDPPSPLVFDDVGELEKVTVVEPDDAYSSWFTFTTERVHATNLLGALFLDGFDDGTVDAWANAVP
ncbi:MAG: hypothetical protein AAGN46_01875 [Acidobacteriota bacterium]